MKTEEEEEEEERWEARRFSDVVLDGQVLAAHHAISLEPLAAELLGGSLRRVGPLDGDAVVVGVLGGDVEGVTRDGHQHGFLGVEHSTRRIHSQAARVGRLDRPADASSTRVDDLNGERRGGKQVWRWEKQIGLP